MVGGSDDHLLEQRLARVELARLSGHELRELGIDFRSTEPATGGVYVVPIIPMPPASFVIEEGGAEAWTIEVLDEEGECVDLLAWRPASPERWRTMFGTAPALGMAAAVAPATYWGGLPLQLFRTPLEWLQALCDGAVVLDRARGARWLLWLHDIGMANDVAPRDDAHAAEIEAARLALIHRQRILVPTRKAA